MFPKAYYQENENLVHHLKLKKGDVGRYVIMPGDPKRCVKIAKRFDDAKLIADYREYATYTGYINGVKVSTTSHGIGGPSTAIALEELIKVGADTFIRVGTCGGMNMEVLPGDVVIVNGAIKGGGTMDNYIPKEFPCVPNIDVLEAMIEGADKIKTRTHVGVVQCKDAFYAQHAPESMAVDNELLYKWDSYIKAGCLASEMESATLFAVGAAKNVRTGAAMLVLHNQERVKNNINDPKNYTGEEAIDLIIESIKILIDKDKK
ncbi:nucleoside phosphorylase [Brachyspira hyodysenteriae]|uniref:nucleoside phosphorylase n=1 Tax=Brachyspira hyodysenteriae TaxID=159 RepID=UPI0022CDA77E|nr:nucleoside phosphorylase [Brachyspira hyodysenteriae]MCZ9838990.1 nucleoside phosphorylase [Brachyspira hyodysenteriae]MCZ9847609.1 nucleoside phosphorylase [Brachyspira hyodysenteriae]MCZ9851458.1 nucleoside phosphorylase [Brachyspira hyodysenteriae]MCZ9859815.1 nucleoside phosphorylase [Brachyspira hyodysenteriae]MCZ9871011.1 nucleoside phosphorylase [Brachyspira hyodysenteriae]